MLELAQAVLRGEVRQLFASENVPDRQETVLLSGLRRVHAVDVACVQFYIQAPTQEKRQWVGPRAVNKDLLGLHDYLYLCVLVRGPLAGRRSPLPIYNY